MNDTVNIIIRGDSRCLHCRLMREASQFMGGNSMRLGDVVSALESVLVDILACAVPTAAERAEGLEIFSRHVAEKFAALDAGPPSARPTAH